MSEEYVSKDIFNEIIKRMEAMNEAHEERTARIIEEIRGEQKRLDEKIEGAIDTFVIAIQDTNKRIDDIHSIVNGLTSKIWSVLGIMAGFCAVVIAGVQVWLSLRG